MISRRQYFEDKLGLTKWTQVPKWGDWTVFGEQWGTTEGLGDEHCSPGREIWQVCEFWEELENGVHARSLVKFINVQVRDTKGHNSGNNHRTRLCPSIERWAEKSGHLLCNSIGCSQWSPRSPWEPGLGPWLAALVQAFLSGYCLCLISGQGIAHSCQFSCCFFLPWLILNLGFASLGHNCCFQFPKADLDPITELRQTEGAAVQVAPPLISFPDSRRKSFQSILCSQFLIVILLLLILLLNSWSRTEWKLIIIINRELLNLSNW